MVLFDSEIASARGTLGAAVSITGDVLIDGSTISESGGRYIPGSAVEANGDLVVLNSTIAGSHDFYTAPDGAPGLGIRADAGSVVEI